jgi:hypothetical protein
MIRMLVAAGIGLAMFGTLVVLAIKSRYNLESWHRFAVPIVACLSCWWLARGIAILASPEARHEPMVRDSDGKKSAGPITSGGIARAVFGFLLYTYPLILLGDALYRLPAEPAAAAPAPSTPGPSPSRPPEPRPPENERPAVER